MSLIYKIAQIHKWGLASATDFYVKEEGPIVGPRSAHAVTWSIILLYFFGPVGTMMIIGLKYSESIYNYDAMYG